VRDISHDKIVNNAETQAIKQIVGLQHKKVYSTTDGLRYGHIMIMTDQDHDGSHIKGLIINFLETSFPGLLGIPGFLVEFITPIVKVSIMRGKKVDRVIPFYTMPQYEKWRDEEGKTCVWKQKYYKGLGTSEPNREGREYFSQLDRHVKRFESLNDDDRLLIDLVFDRKKADARKDWLRAFKPGTHLDPDLNDIPISEFINKEFILFSMADNIRSLPSMMDGLKPGQRKILYGCFKRNLVNEIKVAQLGGYVSENTGYHHGEQSLYLTIVGLAQDFVGSNNLYFLMPNGSFGSRATGGKDASAPRYIFTELNPLTRKVFNPKDDPLYHYMEDDESTVEPEYYAPIIPTILVNGADGIGTGWSCNIPCYNPEDLVANLKKLMNGEEPEPMTPWYRGWTGTIERVAPDKFIAYGRIEQLDDRTLAITELPIRMWTQSMKLTLLNAIAPNPRESNDKEHFIEDMTEEHGVGIKFVVTLNAAQMEQALKEGLLRKFKLTSSISLGNMVAYDAQGRLKKYESVEQILVEFYYVRLEMYQRRKDHLADNLRNQLEKLTAQARFIKLIIDKKLNISNRRRTDLISELEQLKFPKFGKDGVPVYEMDPEEETEISIVLDEFEKAASGDEQETSAPVEVNKPSLPSYEYLLGMAIWSLTKERYEKLLKQRDGKEDELNNLLKLSAKDLWNIDLDDFLDAWHKFEDEDREKREAMIPDKKAKKGKAKSKRAVRKKADDSELKQGAKKPFFKVEKETVPKVETDDKPRKGLTQPKLPIAKTKTEDLPVLFGKGTVTNIFGSPVGKKPIVDEYSIDADNDLEMLTKGFQKQFSAFDSPKKLRIAIADESSPNEASSSSSRFTFMMEDDEDDLIVTSNKAAPPDDEDDLVVDSNKAMKTTKPAPKPKTKSAPKKKAASTAKKTPKSKTFDLSELSNEELEVVAPVAKRPTRAVATRKKVYSIEAISDEDEDVEMVDEPSVFNSSEEEESE
jgi:DNA topoisomerase-2